MTEENFIAVIEVLMERTPFRAFTLELHSGIRFEIDHQEAVDLADGIAVFHAPGSIPVFLDATSVSHVVDGPASDCPNGSFS